MIQFRQLQCFKAVLLHGTTTRAAELLGLSQPAVSLAISTLEKEVGFLLFYRHGNRLNPTPEAKLFYTQASSVIDGAEDLPRAAKKIISGKTGKLSIAAYASVSMGFLPRLIAKFMIDRPLVHTKIISGDSSSVRNLVSTQLFDIGIAELPLDYPASFMEVFSYRCEIMVPKGHALSGKPYVTPKDLDGVPFITLFRGDPIYQKLASAFSSYGSQWNVIVETEYFATACELVASGMGVGVIDPVISAPFTNNVSKCRFEPEIDYKIAILYPTSMKRSKISVEFSDLLRKNLKGNS